MVPAVLGRVKRLAQPRDPAPDIAADDKRTDDDKLRDLYAVAYGRDPAPDEIDFCKQHIAKKAAQEPDAAKKPSAVRQAYEDLVWALVSSKEFLFNH